MTGRARREAVQHADASARLSQELHVLREGRGLTQTALAEAAGVSLATVAKLEQQQTVDPGFFTVAALAGILGVALDDLAATVTEADADRLPLPTVSVGYEGYDQAALVEDLCSRGVAVVADVRLNAVSRRPGFSKTSLRTALGAAGIEYRHFRALGNPQDNRAAFRTGHVDQGRAVFARRLNEPASAAALAELANLSRTHLTAVLCVERDERHCHRKVILDRLT